MPASDLDAARNTASQAHAALAAGMSGIAVAQRGVDQARTAVEQAALNRARAIVTSPIDGIVAARNAVVGQTVAATLETPVLFDIAADFSRMHVEVDVDETDIGGIETGTPVTFEVESFPGEFTGTVSQVRLQPAAEQTTTATTAGAPTPVSALVASVVGYATIIDAPNPDGRLRPGMTATVTPRGTHLDDAPRIPNAALSFWPPDSVSAARARPAGADAAGTPAADPRVRRVWGFDGTEFMPVDVRTGITDGQWTELVGDGQLRENDLVATAASMAAQSTAR